MQTINRIGVAMLFCGALVGGGLTLARSQDSVEPLRPSRFHFAESMRREERDRREGFSTTVHESGSGGQATIDFEVPISASITAFPGSTAFVLKAGTFDFRGTLDSDPDYRPGVNSATLKLTNPTSSGKSRSVYATVHLRWNRDKLTGKVDASTCGALHSVAAEDYVRNAKGDFNGETNVKIEFGGAHADGVVPFRGHLNRIAVETIDVSGTITTLNVHGDLKKE